MVRLPLPVRVAACVGLAVAETAWYLARASIWKLTDLTLQQLHKGSPEGELVIWPRCVHCGDPADHHSRGKMVCSECDPRDLPSDDLMDIPDGELPGMWERADFMGGPDWED